MSGGQFGFVCLPALTMHPHGGESYAQCGQANETKAVVHTRVLVYPFTARLSLLHGDSDGNGPKECVVAPSAGTGPVVVGLCTDAAAAGWTMT